MSKRVTIADIARVTGVHEATVSRALNASTAGRVKAHTRARIQRAACDLGYVPNALARSLSTHSSSTIGVIVPDLMNPLFPPIVRGIESVLAPRGYTALVTNTDSRDDLERAAFDSLLARQVDGFIVATGHSHHKLLRDAFERGVRVVTVNRGSLDAPFSMVTADNAAGIRAILRHLVDLGHRRITHLAGPRGLMTCATRADTFRAFGAERSDLELAVVEVDSLSIGAGQAAAAELWRSSARPSALVAVNDMVAIGALRAAREAGIECPADISITGFNDIPLAEDLAPPLSTVRVPHFEMGVHAARLLLDTIADDPASITDDLQVVVTLPAVFVARGSTGPVHARFARALPTERTTRVAQDGQLGAVHG